MPPQREAPAAVPAGLALTDAQLQPVITNARAGAHRDGGDTEPPDITGDRVRLSDGCMLRHLPNARRRQLMQVIPPSRPGFERDRQFGFARSRYS